MRQAHQKGLSILAADVANKSVPSKKSHPSKRQRRLRRLERDQEDPNFFIKDKKGKRIFFESAKQYQLYLNGDLPATYQRSTPRGSVTKWYVPLYLGERQYFESKKDLQQYLRTRKEMDDEHIEAWDSGSDYW